VALWPQAVRVPVRVPETSRRVGVPARAGGAALG